MKQILLTGFEPFSDIKINPSEILVSDLFEELQKRNEIGVHKVIFPVDYQKADSVLKDIQFSNYDFIFQFGVAAKRSYISLERVALNWIESQIPDNSGAHISEKKIDLSLPDAALNRLDLARISQELNGRFPNNIEVSLSAGAYLCNFVYFKTLTQTSKCLFTHIPTRLNFSEQDWNHDCQEYRSYTKSVGLELIKRVL